jgi:hypothetical protein
MSDADAVSRRFDPPELEWVQRVFVWLERLHEHDQILVNLLRESNALAHRNHHQGEQIMAALDDLNANISTINASITALGVGVDTLIARPAPVGGVPEADVAAAAAAVAAANTAVTDLQAKVDAANNPPAAP